MTNYKHHRLNAWTGHTARARDLIRILDLAGMQKVEDALVSDRDDLREEIDRLSVEHFGITEAETWPSRPPGFDEMSDREQEAYLRQADRWNAAYQTHGLDAHEVTPILAAMGFDFRNAYGLPAKLTPHFMRQAEAAAKKMRAKARMPLSGKASVEQFESRLSAEVADFQRSRKR